MSNTRRIINITLGLVLSVISGFWLYSLGELAHIDLSYNELDNRGRIELWIWRIVSVVIATLLFYWVVRKNTSVGE